MSDALPIVRLAARGDGVTADGRFVAGAAVGDIVRFEGERAVVTPGTGHVAPVCRHFGSCGGCQLQHVTDAAYGDFVTDRILRAMPGIVPQSIAPLALSPPRSRRRAALRALKRGGRLTIGFNEGASHRVIDLMQCEVLLPELFALIAPQRRLLQAALADGQGAGVTLTASESGVDMLLANVPAERLADIERLTDFAAAQDLARLSIDGPDDV
ncbi:MAG: hypothetical protein RL490_1562, partial [Pseudomonadota bacterium]